MFRRGWRMFARTSVVFRSAFAVAQERVLIAVAVAIAEAEREHEHGQFFDRDQIKQLLEYSCGKPNLDRARYLQLQADQAKSRGDLKKAIALYGRAIKHTPYNAALFLLRGTALIEANLPRDAAKDFVAGLDLDPGNQTLTFLMHTANAKAAEQAAVRNVAPAMRLLKNA